MGVHANHPSAAFAIATGHTHIQHAIAAPSTAAIHSTQKKRFIIESEGSQYRRDQDQDQGQDQDQDQLPTYANSQSISRDSRHKRSASGAKRAQYRKKRKFELGRQAANTKLGAKRIHEVRTRGGNRKFRAMRLDAGNFSWGSEAISRKTRIVAVVYNASNNELVRT
ncbi:40S ribosomal protein, partial [Mortierella sp. 14UC]